MSYDDEFRSIRSKQEEFLKATLPLIDQLKATKNPAFLMQLDAININKSLLQALPRMDNIFSAMDAIKHIPSISAITDSNRRFLETINAVPAIKTFVLPDVPDLQIILKNAEHFSAISSIQNSWHIKGLDIYKCLSAMHHPWLDTENPFRSVTGFSELFNIGNSLKNLAPFGSTIASQLRSDLGDWRDSIAITPSLSDQDTRIDLYLDQGLDLALTNFPARSFIEGTSKAGLRSFLEKSTDSDSIGDDNEEEHALKRTNRAHNLLMRFEYHLRRYIASKMTEACGDNWIKHRVPGTIREAWINRSTIALEAGDESRPIIDYADFTDYIILITKSDNWKEVFKAVFKRPELVKESFQRLYPYRLSTMHARPITQEDELLLIVETMRICKAMGINLNLEVMVKIKSPNRPI